MSLVNTTRSIFNRGLLYLLRRTGNWLPDELYLKFCFHLSTGYSCNIKNPITFQEKIQWLKLHDRKAEYTDMVDKYTVKKIVTKKIGQEYVIPTLGVWNNFDEIDFNDLPQKFVLKTTHGGGSLGVVICKDKDKFNYSEARKRINQSLEQSIYKYMREWPYENVSRRIIAESFLDVPNKVDLTDYKIFCFNGVPKYIQVIQDRHENESIDFFDIVWNHQPFVGLTPNCKNAQITPEKPKNLDKMLQIASKLAENTTFIRVDLYNIDGKIFFGELTFYPASGFGKFTPSNWDKYLGDLLLIDTPEK